MKSIPLLVLVVGLYNVLAFGFAGSLDSIIWTVHLSSGADWSFSFNDMLLSLAVILLYIEILKSTRSGMSTVIDHMFSLALFIICLLEFLFVPQVGTSTFFVIILIVLLDVVAGFTITISTSTRDINVNGDGVNIS
ncbi:MAG: hypothetical protein HQL69_19080 [Magnetococcales bacterium]|nr:hypothetical protein [Magnetococcales bacterium]